MWDFCYLKNKWTQDKGTSIYQYEYLFYIRYDGLWIFIIDWFVQGNKLNGLDSVNGTHLRYLGNLLALVHEYCVERAKTLKDTHEVAIIGWSHESRFNDDNSVRSISSSVIVWLFSFILKDFLILLLLI